MLFSKKVCEKDTKERGKMKMRKRFSKCLSAVLSLSLLAGLVGPTTALAQPTNEDIVVLYTNDVHCTSDEGMAYAAISGYKAEMEEKYGSDYVTLVDNGDAIQGAVLGTLSKGGWIVDIMNKVGYELAVPGNHEFDFGMETFLSIANEQADYQYLSCNFLDAKGKQVLSPYVIKQYGDVEIAYVGISTPETISKSTPTFFQNEKGEYIYSFCQDQTGEALYKQVQTTVNAARADGADYVVALAHLGEDAQSSPWMSTEVIANTTGIDVVLDGHSHTTEPSKEVPNADGDKVLLSQTGTKATSVGKLVIEADGDMSTELVPLDAVNTETAAYKATKAYVEDIQKKYQAVTQEMVGHTDVTLTVNDPATGERAIRSAETNMGDFCADAYRTVMGADIGFVNGGGIRADIAAGEITYGDMIAVHPFGNTVCLVEVSGQQIIDALELGCMYVGKAESGGFLQVSGITYRIDTARASNVVVDTEGSFVKVDGPRRVYDVKVLNQKTGAYEAIDAKKTYTLAGHNYMLKNGGDGYSMFGTDKVKILKDEIMVDNEVLMTYLSDHLQGVVGSEYANPYGQGRIVMSTSYPDVDHAAWYSGPVYDVSAKGLMGSTDGLHFNPNQTVSRATVYTILHRMVGQPTVSEHPLKDTAGKWYEESVNWAASVGLIEGEYFSKDRALTRAEAAEIMKDFAVMQGVPSPSDDGSMKQAVDYESIPVDALEGMGFCYYSGVMVGNESGALMPNNEITRAEYAKVLWSYDALVAPHVAA